MSSSSGARKGTGPPWSITLASTGSRLLGKRVGRMVLRAAPSVCGVPVLLRADGVSNLEAPTGGGVKRNDSLLGNRGGTSVWTTLKEPGVVSLASLGEEGM